MLTTPSFQHFIIIKAVSNVLSALDTGVVGLDFSPLSEEDYPFSLEELEDSGDPTNTQIGTLRVKDGKLYSISHNEEGNLEITYVRFQHRGSEHHEHFLDWHQESQGTQKIITLLPWLWLAVQKFNDPPILLVDELDTSLHTKLTQALIQGFLHECTNSTCTQLIFTTHDLLLMDLTYLRKDEIWIMDKHSNGESTLIGLPEYRGIRSDKDIRKSYLEGRFGGTPQLDGFTLEK